MVAVAVRAVSSEGNCLAASNDDGFDTDLDAKLTRLNVNALTAPGGVRFGVARLTGLNFPPPELQRTVRCGELCGAAIGGRPQRLRRVRTDERGTGFVAVEKVGEIDAEAASNREHRRERWVGFPLFDLNQQPPADPEPGSSCIKCPTSLRPLLTYNNSE